MMAAESSSSLAPPPPPAVVGDAEPHLQIPEPPNLPFQDINIVVVTDVHSWVGGQRSRHHNHHSNNDDDDDSAAADYGDVLSFYQHLKSYIINNSQQSQSNDKKDLFFVMNGDFVDGTGLSTVPPSYLTPILSRMPFDAINLGNHELYNAKTLEYLIQENGFIDHWNGTYLSSNALISETKQPIGNRYTYLRGKHTNTTILTFGFLYNFDKNCNGTTVEKVQDAVQQSWFYNVLTSRNNNSYDAILVLAHMDAIDTLVYTILDAIRAIIGDDNTIPIQFLTGHSHRRAYETLDPMASSFEAGHFLDTVGFVSFPVLRRSSSSMEELNNKTIVNTDQQIFQHVFLDATKKVLNDTLGPHTNLETPDGLELTKFIQDTRTELGLDELLGCSPATYKLNGQLDDPNSLWGLWLSQIVPTQLLQRHNYNNKSQIYVQGTGAFRDSLMQGVVTEDDIIIVCPFNDTVWQITDDVSGSILHRILNDFAISSSKTYAMLPSIAIAPLHVKIERNRNYALFVPEFHLKEMTDRLKNATRHSNITFHPTKVKDVTTTNMWRNYVIHEWNNNTSSSSGPCPEAAAAAVGVVEDNNDDGYIYSSSSSSLSVSPTTTTTRSSFYYQLTTRTRTETTPLITTSTAFIIIIIAIVVMCACILLRRRRRRKGKGIITGDDSIADNKETGLLSTNNNKAPKDATRPYQNDNSNNGSHSNNGTQKYGAV